MKFTTQSSELTKALFRVQGIADKKSTMPILAHVLIEASNAGELRLSATDLEVGLMGTYNAEVEKPGSIAVHARHLYDILKALPDSDVVFEVTDNNWIKISSGKSDFKLVGMNGDDFPNLPLQSLRPWGMTWIIAGGSPFIQSIKTNHGPGERLWVLVYTI